MNASLATTRQTGPGSASGVSSLPWIDWALLAGVGVMALGPVSLTWNSNPNYSFGWLIPLVSVVLFAERWSGRPPRAAAGQARLAGPLLLWGLFFFTFRLAAEADSDWRPGLWIVTGLYVAALLGWLRLYGGAAWMRHFAFPVCFLFLGLPWFFVIEYPLVQGLMRWNTVLVAHSLQALAIYAEPEGNIIQLRHSQLGVEEACSGILSLQASLVIGCLLGEIYRLSVRRRVVLALASMALALLGNYLRTFFLALVAFYNGSDSVTSWHDTAGYAILVFVGTGSWLSALWLAAASPVSAAGVGAREGDDLRPARSARRLALAIFAVALLAEVCIQAWFEWRESSLAPHPEWSVHRPASDTFKEVALSRTSVIALRCDDVLAGQWRDAQGWNWSAYWLRYNPKTYTRVALNWHNPDNCLPSVGLVKDQDYPDFPATVNGLDFWVQPKRFVAKEGPVYVFWIVYPLRGDVPAAMDTLANAPFSTKFRSHLRDIWNGDRGVGVETLEVGLSGPPDYESARADFLAGLKMIVTPGVSGAGWTPAGTSR